MDVENRLIIALKSGDEFAFKTIYDKYSNKIFDCSFFLLKDKDWSADIVQEVFIKLWNYRTNLSPDSNLWSFLYVLTKRLCFNRLKEIQRDHSSFDRILKSSTLVTDSSHDILVAKDLAFHLQKALDQLSDRQREIFELSRFEGLSHQEIAQRLEISPNTVKNHMVSALKLVRKYVLHVNCLALLSIIDIL